MRPGLKSVDRLLKRLGSPHRQYPSVLVAGTNGKGSVSQFLVSILDECGFSAGHYSSPHLMSIRERIAVKGSPITREDFSELFTEISAYVAPGQPLTYFEMLTATALLYFSRRDVDIAVLEVGMGGRLDATNVVEPLMTILTPISLDHQNYLGDSISEIATEKAGTIHRGCRVLSALQVDAAAEVIQKYALEREAPLSVIDGSEFQIEAQADGCFRIRDDHLEAVLRLPGRHQAENAALAVAASRELEKMRWDLKQRCVSKGLEDATFKGRLQKIDSSPDIFLDGGHNPAAACVVGAYLKSFTSGPRHLVISMMEDKDAHSVAKILTPFFDRQFFFEMGSIRAASLQQLRSVFPDASQANDAVDALFQAKEGAATVVVFGSFRLVRDILQIPQYGVAEITVDSILP
jgi:dihydrofolate synthase/folylpolyglutamate synthase